MYSLFKWLQISSPGHATSQATHGQIEERERLKDRLVDNAMDAYVDWREECVSVGDAYRRWESAPADDAELAFAGYLAALDREEAADRRYARLIRRVAPLVGDARTAERHEARA